MEKNEFNTPAKYDQIILLTIMPKVVLFEIDQINLGSRPSVPFELRSAVVARASSLSEEEEKEEEDEGTDSEK